MAQQEIPAATFRIVHAFPDNQLERDWRRCLERDRYPSHYAAPEFFLDPSVNRRRPFAVLALSGGAVCGVLTGVHHGNHVTSGLGCRPQLCVDDTAERLRVAEALVLGFLAEAGSARLLDIYSWYPMDGLRSRGFQLLQDKGVVMLDLSLGRDALFKQMHGKRRNGIRYAMRQGVDVFEASTLEHVAEYHRIHLAWCHAKQVPPWPFEVMEGAWRRKESRRLLLARVRDRIVAGAAFRFHAGGLVEYAENNSYPEAKATKANELLVWRAVEWACQEGFRSFSLGGVHRFLQEFGGTSVPTYRHRWDRTFLRRHDLREQVMAAGRRLLRRGPRPFESAVRWLLGKDLPEEERRRAEAERLVAR